MTTLRTQIVRAAYQGREFPAFEWHDENAHSFVEHKAWRVNGADVESTGREPIKCSCKIGLLQGISGWPSTLFPELHDELEDTFRTDPQGVLRHPYYGEMRVQIVKWSRSLDPTVQQGVFLQVEFLEISASAYRSFATFEPEPGQAIEDAAQDADDAIEAYDDESGIDPLTPTVQEQLAYLEEEDRSADEAYAALDVIQRQARAALESEALAAVEAHDARESLRTLVARCDEYARQYLTPRAQPRVYTVPQTMSLARVAALVYGDATRTAEIRKANRIPDETFVPSGTVLLLPKAPA